MQSNQTKKGKTGFTGLKILIGALSLTGTFGIWGSIANKQVEVIKPTQDQGNNNLQDSSNLVVDLPPLPTLVPIRSAANILTVAQNTSNQLPQTLRQVTQPTLAPVPATSKPVFERLTISRPGSGGGGSSGGGGAASSGSSR